VRFRSLILVVGVSLLLVPRARAGWLDGKTTFAQGTWTFQTYANYISAKGSSDEILASGAMGAGYFVFDNLELNLEILGYHVTQDGPDADAIGLQLLLRHHLLQFDRLSLFVDVGPGLFEGSTEVPHDGVDHQDRVGLGGTRVGRDPRHQRTTRLGVGQPGPPGHDHLVRH
jgi:hypothetical protein